MKPFERLWARVRYHFERGDYWFPLAIIAFAVAVLVVVKLY
jgi:hypothetical protein